MDLNSDIGESFGRWVLGDDAGVLEQVTSVNAACGFHAGDPSTIRVTCERAVSQGVVIGAQVGYHDLAGFGRRFIDVAQGELTDDVLYQIGALDAFAKVAGAAVRYVKPHGALYNATFEHEEQARAVVDAVRAYDPSLPILGLPGSVLLKAAEDAGLRAVREAFADRAYTPQGTLVPRSEQGAVLDDPEQVAQRVLTMVTQRETQAIDGSVVRVEAESICVHGDSPGAVRMAGRIREVLAENGVELRSFV